MPDDEDNDFDFRDSITRFEDFVAELGCPEPGSEPEPDLWEEPEPDVDPAAD